MFKRLSVVAAAAVIASSALVAPAKAAVAVDVVAVDFKLKGVPAVLQYGAHTFSFVNNSERHVHEFVLFKNKSEHTPEELLRMPPKEAEKHVKFMGATFAKPGKVGKEFKVWLKPGKYFAVCFVEHKQENGDKSPPHWQKGMLERIRVDKK